MDEIVRTRLEAVTMGKKFHKAFSTNNFPTRNKKGGTAEGRKLLHDEGNEYVATYYVQKLVAVDHDQETLRKLVNGECKQIKRRRKRSTCLLEDRDAVTVDKESIKFEENKVEFDVVDRRNAKEQTHMKISLGNVGLALPKLIKEHITKSRTVGATKAYARFNKGLAVHGLIFSVFEVSNVFSVK